MSFAPRASGSRPVTRTLLLFWDGVPFMRQADYASPPRSRPPHTLPAGRRPLSSSPFHFRGVSAEVLCAAFHKQFLRDTLTEIEKKLIERAMEQAQGVQAEAARMLGLSRSDIGYKVTKYAIER